LQVNHKRVERIYRQEGLSHCLPSKYARYLRTEGAGLHFAPEAGAMKGLASSNPSRSCSEASCRSNR
jgi:hypothetical protein